MIMALLLEIGLIIMKVASHLAFGQIPATFLKYMLKVSSQFDMDNVGFMVQLLRQVSFKIRTTVVKVGLCLYYV